MEAERHIRISAWRFARRTGLVIGLSASLCGCSSFSKSKESKDSEANYTKRMRHLELELKRSRQHVEALKERNLVLEKRESLRSQANPSDDGRDSVPVAFVAPKNSSDSSSVKAEPQKLTREPAIENVGSAETGEHFLYSKVLETYQKRKPSELQKSVQLLLRTYPDSVFADNALYLAGMLAVEVGELDRAKTYFDRLLSEHPLGNKAVSALFAMAIVEKRMKKVSEAKKLLEKVLTQYPGSLESKRATLELKLLNAGESKGET